MSQIFLFQRYLANIDQYACFNASNSRFSFCFWTHYCRFFSIHYRPVANNANNNNNSELYLHDYNDTVLQKRGKQDNYGNCCRYAAIIFLKPSRSLVRRFDPSFALRNSPSEILLYGAVQPISSCLIRKIDMCLLSGKSHVLAASYKQS